MWFHLLPSQCRLLPHRLPPLTPPLLNPLPAMHAAALIPYCDAMSMLLSVHMHAPWGSACPSCPATPPALAPSWAAGPAAGRTRAPAHQRPQAHQQRCRRPSRCGRTQTCVCKQHGKHGSSGLTNTRAPHGRHALTIEHTHRGQTGAAQHKHCWAVWLR